MLTDLLRIHHDPLTSMIAALNGNQPTVKRIDQGCYQIGHFSSDMVCFGCNDYNFHLDLGTLGTYGVCDSPEQFLEKFRRLLMEHPACLAVFFTHVAKNPENANMGGGWRWHKWGAYVGEGDPKCEYLDDETGFENGVFVYHIHDISELVTLRTETVSKDGARDAATATPKEAA